MPKSAALAEPAAITATPVKNVETSFFIVRSPELQNPEPKMWRAYLRKCCSTSCDAEFRALWRLSNAATNVDFAYVDCWSGALRSLLRVSPKFSLNIGYMAGAAREADA